MNRDANPKPPALDPMSVSPRTGSGYPAPFRAPVQSREKRALGTAAGLTNFGVNHVRLPPGTMSSMRHWHTKQDEFIYVLEGELVLVTDAGEQILHPGMAAGFPAGRPDGHHLINRSARDAFYLEVGDRTRGDEVFYPDIDLAAKDTPDGTTIYTRRNGEPY